MTFLRLNGWTLPIRDGSAARVQDVLGELRSSWGNRPTRKRQAISRTWRGRAFPMEAEDADTLEALVEGRGHRWAFDPVDGFFSSAGLGPEAGFSIADLGVVQVSGSPIPPVLYCLECANGEGLVFDADLCSDEWTVLFWTAGAPSGAWTHKVARSDLARWENGVRNDLLSVEDEILVEAGALAIGDFASVGTCFADLVLLPFKASASFIESFYRQAEGLGLYNRWRLSGDIRDELFDRATGVSTSGVSYAPGQITKSAVFNGGTDEITLDANAGTATSGVSVVSVSFWLKMNADPPDGFGSRQGVIFLTRTGTDPLLSFSVYSNSTARSFLFEGSPAAGDPNTFTGTGSWAEIGLDTWFHVLFEVDKTNRTLRIFLNGTQTGITVDRSGIWTTNPFDGVCIGGAIGRNIDAGNSLTGQIENLGIHHRALTDAEILELYQSESRECRSLAPRSFSKLPEVELWGDVDGCEEPVSVLGAPPAQVYVQHGSKTGGGWLNNSREVELSLEEVNPRGPVPGLPIRPTAAVLLDDRQTWDPSGTTRDPWVGGLPSILGVDQNFARFPFGDFRVRSFDGTQDELETSGAWAGFFEGSPRLSVIAFVRLESLGVTRTICQFETGVNLSHYSLQVDAAGAIFAGARSESADAFQSVTLTPSPVFSTGSDAWAAIGHAVDFAGATQDLHLVRSVDKGLSRAAEVESFSVTDSTNTFGSTRWIDSATDFRIGRDVIGGAGWIGEIAYLGFIRGRMITASEVRQSFEAFRAGIYR